MKKLFVFYISFISFLIFLLGYNGCSEPETNLTQAIYNGIHPAGWTNSASTNFHGRFIGDSLKWNLSYCKTCHGSDYRGGNTGKSCFTCHTGTDGPEECNVCHGDTTHAYPPKALNGDVSTSSIGVGMHMQHLAFTKYSALVSCNECHTPVASFDDTNHINPSADGIAEVTFGSLSRTTLGGGIIPNPVWSRTNATCSDLYCHGTFKNGNVNATGIWTDSTSVVCGTCHGDPVTGNPNPKPNGQFVAPHYSFYTINTCWQCHSSVINAQGQITAPEKHINGVVNVYP